MNTIFTVTKEHLEHLNPEEAVTLFRELLWAESTALGIAKNLINVPTAITVADGGIDAEVKDVTVTGGQGIIKQGLTRYQVKTGNFSPTKDTDVKSILFKDGSTELKERVKSCLDRDGTLIIVVFGWDDPEQKESQHANKFLEKLKTVDARYGTAKIEIWPQNKLIGFIKPFPSLALQVNGHGGARFQTHKSWSQDAEMRRAFVSGPSQAKRISDIRKSLRTEGSKTEAAHVRIYGEPGIGKTRLVLEATREDDLSPLVIYCESAGKFRDSDLMVEILKEDNEFSAILVVDECNKDDRAYIWDKLKYRGSRMKLVSLYNEYDDTAGNISYLNTPPLEQEQVSSIIKGYGVPKERADVWAELCSGSPRVAHVIGWNLIHNSEDLLKPPDTVNIWDRYVVGEDNPTSQQVQQRRIVLGYLSLFKRFGFGSPVVVEAKAVAQLVARADPQITWVRFQEIIKSLRDRKILQGESTLYITPKALHIFLWIDWWDTYGSGFQFDEFSRDLPGHLTDWFYEMFRYAAESDVAIHVVRGLLGEGGPFQNDTYLQTELGASFFLALAEAEPVAALGCLKRTVETWDKGRLLEFTTGRREVIWALERIAMHRTLFPDAARVLLSLGEAENETYSNNASGVFADLFSPAPGRVAPTEASPEERFPLLAEAMESPSKEKRLLALNACSAALQHGHFTRMIGSEYQGMRELNLWTPKTWGEIFEAYRKVWQYVCDKLGSMEKDEQQKAIRVLLDNARGLGNIPSLLDMVIETLAVLSTKPFVKKEEVISTVVQIIHYDRESLSEEGLRRWERLRDGVVGSDYSSQLRRYIALDLVEDHFDENGKYIGQTQSKLEELARQSSENEELLLSNLEWLIGTETQSSFRFAYEVGKRDKDSTLLHRFVEAQRTSGKRANATMLGGYLRALIDKDTEAWEMLLDELAADQDLRQLVPELTWRSGLTERAMARVLGLLKEGASSLYQLRMLTGHVGVLSEVTFKNLMEFLLDRAEPFAVSIGLYLFDAYYLRDEQRGVFPEELTFRLLTHPSLFGMATTASNDPMDEFRWAIVAQAFLKRYPARSIEMARQMLEHFGNESAVVTRYNSHAVGVLNQIAKEKPGEVWDLLVEYIGPPIDTRAYALTRWLRGQDFFERGGESVLQLIPPDKIWEWVEKDVEKRARYLASFVPKTLFREKDKMCLTYEVLRKYGHREDVRNGLMNNFSTEGWSGPASLHFQAKKQALLDLKKDENHPNVIRWIEEYVASLDRQIEREKVDEERED